MANRKTDFRVTPPGSNDLGTLPSVTIEVELDTPLAEIGRLALESLGFHWEFGTNYHFLTTPSSIGRRLQCPFSPYVDAGGIATWLPDQFAFGWGFYSVAGIRVDDVVRTQEAGLFDGDPFALLLEEFWGAGGPVLSWDDLVRFLATAGAVRDGVKAIKAAAKVLRVIVDRGRSEWDARHANPKTFFSFILARDSWEYPRLAELLNVSFETAIELLSALGYRQDAVTGAIYRLDPSAPEAAFRRALEDEFLRWNPRVQLRSFWDSQRAD